MRTPGVHWPARPLRRDVVTERLHGLAVHAAERPLRTLDWLLALNLGLAACFTVAGSLVGDRALFFRELAPGTWLSFAQLLFIAAVARAVHSCDAPGTRWHRSFWGLCSAVFCLAAFDEITQFSIYVSHVLEGAFGFTATSGFHDLQAVLLTLAFAGAALVLLPRALVLRRHPLALCLLVVAALLAVASQGLDSFAAATRLEFVAEETLKLLAEAFFAGGLLVALRDVRARRAAPRTG